MYGNNYQLPIITNYCNKQQKIRVQIEEENLETKLAWTLILQKQCKITSSSVSIACVADII